MRPSESWIFLTEISAISLRLHQEEDPTFSSRWLAWHTNRNHIKLLHQMEETKALANYHMAGGTEQAQIISNDSLTYWSIYNLQINPFLIQAGWLAGGLASPSFGWLFKWVCNERSHCDFDHSEINIHKITKPTDRKHQQFVMFSRRLKLIIIICITKYTRCDV